MYILYFLDVSEPTYFLLLKKITIFLCFAIVKRELLQKKLKRVHIFKKLIGI